MSPRRRILLLWDYGDAIPSDAKIDDDSGNPVIDEDSGEIVLSDD